MCSCLSEAICEMRVQVGRAGTGSHGETATLKTRRWAAPHLLGLSSHLAHSRNSLEASILPAPTAWVVFTGLSAGAVDGPGCPTSDPGTQHSLAHRGPQPAGAGWETGLMVELCAAG